ncbi:MAG: PepSY domain-containing protein [Vibrio gallaecicus]|uniref:PepSY domain-containing protein n=1 Tax=Vibrio TaxID=662 RepID=UPI0010C9B56E|nr:PepSY domain-containing protein [Vibrio gallaecicus]
MLSKLMIATLPLLCALLLPNLAMAKDHNNGHELVQDVYKEGTRIEFDEDQDEVYDAVKDGLIKPFSELYETIESQLNGRVIRVELEEDDDEWVYELKLVHDNNVIKVEYNATTLEMLEIKGRNLQDVIKK